MNDSTGRQPFPLQTLAHELRNRIAPIRNAAALIRLRGGIDAEKLALLIERQLDAMSGALDHALAAEAHGEAAAIAGSPPANAAEAAGSAASQNRRRILVADDSMAMRESLADLLRENGHEVRVAAHGEQALELAVKWLPEVVLLDINMPRLNGYEVARRLRAQFAAQAMKLVMLSGVSLDNATRRNAKEAGFDHCMDKVFDLGTFEALIAED